MRIDAHRKIYLVMSFEQDNEVVQGLMDNSMILGIQGHLYRRVKLLLMGLVCSLVFL
jgi:hypothetical protein